MPWLALSVEVEAGSAEALGDALLEAGAQSVTLEGHEAKTLSALMGQGEDAAGVLAAAARTAGIAPPRFTLLTL